MESAGIGALITMLPTTSSVLDVYCGPSGVLSALGGVRPPLLVDCSTVGPLTAQRVARAAAEAALHPDTELLPGLKLRSPAMLDAPVSGGVTGAAAASLTFMVRVLRSNLINILHLFGHLYAYLHSTFHSRA